MIPVFRAALIVGVLVYLLVIFYLMKKEKLSVKYSIIWLISGAVLLLFALVPYVVLVMGDILHVINPVNFVFMIAFVFVLFILLSLSAAASGFAERIKQLAQKQALLEVRVRELEAQLPSPSDNNREDGAGHAV